jgi:molecular chaperone GrpE
MKFRDKRHGARPEDEQEPAEGGNGENEAVVPVDPAELDAARVRADAAEKKLREVQEAFLTARTDLEKTRERLERDVEKRVTTKFGDLVSALLDTLDDLDRAIESGWKVPGVKPFLEGVGMVRDRFLAELQRAGVERVVPEGAFDPNVAEAVGFAPVDDQAQVGAVAHVVRAGYKLGDRVIRPARVLVGRIAS